jgi:hypothetical protein
MQSVGLNFEVTDIREDSRQRLLRHFAESQQVVIPRRTDRLAEPNQHHQCALEHEAISIPRAGKSIEEPLCCISREHDIRIDTGCLGVLWATSWFTASTWFLRRRLGSPIPRLRSRGPSITPLPVLPLRMSPGSSRRNCVARLPVFSWQSTFDRRLRLRQPQIPTQRAALVSFTLGASC